MRTKLILILLAVSLTFNVFFALGFLGAKNKMARSRTFRGRAELIAKRLDLDEQQWQSFEQLLDEMEQLRKANTPRRDALLAEIVKNNPDEKVLEELVSGDAAEDYRKGRLALIRKFTAMLHPEQREKFIEMVKKRSSASQ